MFSGPKKPYTAVSVQVDRMTSEQFDEEDLSGIIDLIEVIRIQASGPTEAARAIRKKLKYGSPHRQVRALTILDGLIENAGSRFQKTFADEPLLERLRTMPRDDMVDPTVRQKCNVLFRQWAVAYKDTPGLQSIAALHKSLPQAKRRPQRQTKSVRETEMDSDDAQPSPRGHTRNTSSVSASASSPTIRQQVNSEPTVSGTYQSLYKRSKKDKAKSKGAGAAAAPFVLEREKPHIMQTIAGSNVASTNLLNSLQLINREVQRVSENPEINSRFETCKTLRRQVLRYIQLVENDELIGALLTANDDLVKALTAYDLMDRDLEDDSDSEWENAEGVSGAGKQLAGLKLGGEQAAPPPKPARPAAKEESESEESEVEEEEDEDNPFGDANRVMTPGVERPGMNWKTV